MIRPARRVIERGRTGLREFGSVPQDSQAAVLCHDGLQLQLNGDSRRASFSPSLKPLRTKLAPEQRRNLMPRILPLIDQHDL
jgi:hypothetical protein